MQVIVYLFRQAKADAMRLGKIVNACATYSLQPPELTQEFPAAFRTQPWNLFQA